MNFSEYLDLFAFTTDKLPGVAPDEKVIFAFGEYEKGGTYITCETEEGPYDDISVHVLGHDLLTPQEIVVPTYKMAPALYELFKERFVEKVIATKVPIGMGEGEVVSLVPDFRNKMVDMILFEELFANRLDLPGIVVEPEDWLQGVIENPKIESLQRNFLARAEDGCYVAVDNTTGDCWVEEFEDCEDAVAWLQDSTLEAEELRAKSAPLPEKVEEGRTGESKAPGKDREAAYEK